MLDRDPTCGLIQCTLFLHHYRIGPFGNQRTSKDTRHRTGLQRRTNMPCRYAL